MGDYIGEYYMGFSSGILGVETIAHIDVYSTYLSPKVAITHSNCRAVEGNWLETLNDQLQPQA